MDKMTALKEVSEKTASQLQQIELANRLVRKIGKLPDDWKAEYINGGWHGLLFSRWRNWNKEEKGVDPKEYRKVCDLIDGKLGIRLKRQPWIEGEMLYCLNADFNYKINTKINLHIEIRCMDIDKSCELKFTEKIVKIAELGEDCKKELGME